MKKLFFPLLFLCFSSFAQENASFEEYTIEQFYENTRIGGGVFSNDGQHLLINSDETGIFNVFEINVDDGSKKQITSSEDDSFFALDYVPGTDEILYSADKGGNEIDHIFLLKKDGTVKDLTPGIKEKAIFAGWSEDDRFMYYLSNLRDPQFFDLYKMQVGMWKPEMIFMNNEGFEVSGISNNENFLLLSKPVTTSESKLFLYNRKEDQLTEISEEKGNYSASGFSNDDSSFYYITDVGDEFSYLVQYEIATGETSKIFEPDWDVMYSYLSENEKYRVIGINEDGTTRLQVFNNRTGKKVELPEVQNGDILSASFSDNENLLRLSIGTSKTPNNIYVYNFESDELTKLTNYLN
ncbi:MAG TPA: S9 family peptidase, partial [Salinimicrobium sp.]|nr:S9 family peptidase [Salinimicrobium sp.]